MEVAGLSASLSEPLPGRLEVGLGNALFLHGRAEGGMARAGLLRDGVEQAAPVRSAPVRDGAGPPLEWWSILPVGPVASPETVRLSLRSGPDGPAAELGELRLEPGAPTSRDPAPDGGRRVVICMATHQPPPGLFERQLDSIRAQTHRDWRLVISDDASTPDRLAAMREAIGDDDRVELAAHDERLGFYRNFERALRMAQDAPYVALCDQDDRWHPEKLEALLGAIDGGATLAYSDMRIVGDDGRVHADTFWEHRRNNHTDLAAMLVANSVTGAASLFRAELLPYLLPFPHLPGRAFHDHWLALVALALGELAYVDEPLYDYVQHDAAVIGHAAANAGRGVAGLPGVAGRTRRAAGRVARPQARDRYFDDYCRIATQARVLELRCGELMDGPRRAAVSEIARSDESPAALARFVGRSLREMAGGNRTMGVDRSAVAGLVWRRLAAVRRLR